MGCEQGDLVEGQLAGEDDAGGTQLVGEAKAFEAGDGHLGRGVDRQLGGDGADQAAEAEILDDEGVGAGLGDLADQGFGGVQLAGEEKGVECDVAQDAVAVESGERVGKSFDGEIGGAGAGVVGLQAEIDGVGSIFDGGAEADGIAGGGEEFGTAADGGHEGGVFVCKGKRLILSRPSARASGEGRGESRGCG